MGEASLETDGWADGVAGAPNIGGGGGAGAEGIDAVLEADGLCCVDCEGRVAGIEGIGGAADEGMGGGGGGAVAGDAGIGRAPDISLLGLEILCVDKTELLLPRSLRDGLLDGIAGVADAFVAVAEEGGLPIGTGGAAPGMGGAPVGIEGALVPCAPEECLNFGIPPASISPSCGTLGGMARPLLLPPIEL